MEDIPGMRVTVMGLGLNGGGYASVRFFASHGAVVTATDIRDEKILAPTMEKLADVPVRYVLGRHELSDFEQADLVIKNPAVKWDSPHLLASRRIETDISVFLSLNTRPVLGVTGSKGKSTTVSALHYILQKQYPDTDLGGNITVSPLSFIDKKTGDPVVLELSSWQLADLKDLSILDPEIALVTNLMHDHMNHYASMESYADDKRRLFQGQSPGHYTFCNYDEPWGRSFYNETPGIPLYFSQNRLPSSVEGAFLDGDDGYFRKDGSECHIVPETLAIPGRHNRTNILCGAACAALYGVDPHIVTKGAAEFRGIPHRMEKVREIAGVCYYNDSAATIPQAVTQALESFSGRVHVICGGTDKECDFSGFAESLRDASVYLLAGSATDILVKDLVRLGIPYHGPYDSLKPAFEKARSSARKGDTVILSPGAASFGMFLNEFDRGNQFRNLVLEL
ncbi:MAG: UDP-N-acetylmuramoyl-L-alanine--D-glutamate ligase [Spirochaetales bacterium]|nr:UDP-N-acetylmuramoyl-L-alanine--D-glutamate ligase [Spirochaetales bacterium]